MKTFPADALSEGSEAAAEIAALIGDGGIACVPCNGSYRFVCDALDTAAVMRLMAVKSRSGHAPSLIFVSDEDGLDAIATDVPPTARELARALWPGPLTLLVIPNDALPGKVQKQLTKANKRLGVRVPADPAMRAVVRAFGGPVLASSANREKKAGAHSGAVVRQSFGGRLDVFVDAGELGDGVTSTVIDVRGDATVVTRLGALGVDALNAVLDAHGRPPATLR